MTDQLTASQAAARLGVRTETLYAYVSRGLIARQRGAHGSLFDVLEVERFALSRRRTPPPLRGAAPPAGSEGAPFGVIETDITLIDDDRLWFRGVPIEELAAAGAGHGFDAVVRWLFERTDEPRGDAGPLPPAPGADIAAGVVSALPDSAPTFSRLLAAIAALSAVDPERYDIGADAVQRMTVRIISGMTDALPLYGAVPAAGATLAERLWPRLTALPATPVRISVLDAVLTIMIDHDLAVSSLAARAAASARAHPYAVVAAGLGAMDSALHGTMSATVVRVLEGMDAGADPLSAVSAASRGIGAGLPGFGQALYPRGDPRATLLLRRLRDTGDSEAIAAAEAVESLAVVIRERTGLLPTIDAALAAVTVAWGMPPDAGETIFAIARSSGWCAHALDEYTRPPLRLRAIGRYVGPDPVVRT